MCNCIQLLNMHYELEIVFFIVKGASTYMLDIIIDRNICGIGLVLYLNLCCQHL